MERGGLRQFRLHTGAPQRDGAIIRQRFRPGTGRVRIRRAGRRSELNEHTSGTRHETSGSGHHRAGGQLPRHEVSRVRGRSSGRCHSGARRADVR